MCAILCAPSIFHFLHANCYQAYNRCQPSLSLTHTARRLPRFLRDPRFVSKSIVVSITNSPMPLRRRLNPRAFHVYIFSSILLSWFPGFMMSAIVTLDSIEIYNTHEWLPSKPTVYFQCKGENKTYLPDVKNTHISYTFKGEESWQPLTEFPNTKCKRCGLYEEDILKSDIFDEWEFCPSDFTNPDGSYNKFIDNEFNATFLCPDCVPLGSDSNHASSSHNGGKGMHVAVVILISALVSTVFILGLLAAYKYWQKRKREQDQARFLKLFEEGDDIEDELGLGPLGGVI